MCGIWAIFGSNQDVAKQMASCLSIAHRGPDQFRIQNVNHYKNCAFGFHRLAIMEDLQGMQPFRIHKFPHYVLCYNGEIYNYKLLAEQFGFEYETELDGECILHLYAKGGAEFAAAHLDGVFCFTVLDCLKGEVSIARDTYGVRPGFTFTTDSGFLAVCSEAKGLIDLSHDVCRDDVKLETFTPGHVATYSLDSYGMATPVSKKQFHAPGQSPQYGTRFTQFGPKVEDNIRELLTAAVRKRMMGVRRIGCLLSGGLDSSLIAALVCKLCKEWNIDYKIQTFAIGMPGSPDLIAAKKVANHLGTDHHEVTFTPEEGIDALGSVIKHNESFDITTTRASVGMYLLAKYIATKTENIIIFSGEGADEVAQGYIYFHKAPSPAEADTESRRLLTDLYLYDNLRADRTTAAHGLELRVPFLDHQFTSYFLSLPAESRTPKDGVEKHLIRSAFSGTALIPDDILWRPKEAFSDGVSSQKKSWFSYLQDYVDQQVSQEEMMTASELYPHCTPLTKEAFFYRKVFETHYPNQSHLIPYMWMPKWIDAVDPSARTLNHYRDSEVELTTTKDDLIN